MYPSKQNPSYGIFVKKTFDWLEEEYDVTLVKITKKKSVLEKVISYSLFYLKAIVLGVFGNYDYIYAHFISHCALPIQIIKKFKKNVIVIGNIHGEDVFSTYEKYQKNRNKAKKFLENSDFIISPSEYFKNRLVEEYSFSKNKIFVSPSGGIDTSIFTTYNSLLCREEMGLDLEKIYIGFVSRIEEGKGWDIFLKAFKRLAETDTKLRAIMIGEGSQLHILRRDVEEMEISDKVILFPLLSHSKLAVAYNAMDVFCFASRIKAESLGLVGLEAMACGTPCVITNYAGPSSYAKNEYNCLTFNPEDECELAEKIEMLLNKNSEELDNMRYNAQETIKEYESENVKQKFMDFFKFLELRN